MPLDATNFATVVEHDGRNPQDEEAIRVLRAALKLLELGWTKKAYARCIFMPVPSNFRFATSYCGRGALMRAGHDLGLPIERAEQMVTNIIGTDLVRYNDKHNQTDVVWAFQCAIVAYT